MREKRLAPAELIPGLFFENKITEFKAPQTAFSGELQHLFRSRYVNLTTGAGYADVNGRLDSSFRFGAPPFIPIPDTVIEASDSTDVRHTNVYAYSYINPIKDLTFILGASGDFTYGDRLKDTEQLNPKFGMVWNPLPTTTVRWAVFRALK